MLTEALQKTPKNTESVAVPIRDGLNTQFPSSEVFSSILEEIGLKDRVDNIDISRDSNISLIESKGTFTVKKTDANKEQDWKNFIILSVQRSGSTWLSDLFEGHPDVRFHDGECFRSSHELSTCFIRFHEGEANDQLQLTSMHSDEFPSILDKLLSSDPMPAKQYVALKWMVNQLPENRISQVAAYLNNHSIKVINLRRDNYLRQCYSLYDMYQRHLINMNVHDRKGEKDGWTEKKKWWIDPKYWDHCMKWFGKEADTRNKLLNFVSEELVLDVHYSALCSDKEEILKRIQKFLGLKHSIDLENSEYQKMHQQQFPEMVKNWWTVHSYLMKKWNATNIERWSTETECK
eukprot:jgi/Bigna1/146889/aug1.123_g21597